jgi:hypothetical protein
VLVGEGRGDRVGEVFMNHTEVGVSAVDVIAGEAAVVAQVLVAAQAVRAGAIGGKEPGDADTVSFFIGEDVGAGGVDQADDLMAGDDREFGQWEIAFGDVQVGVTDRAGADANAEFVWAGRRVGEIAELEWCGFDRGGLGELHRTHGEIVEELSAFSCQDSVVRFQGFRFKILKRRDRGERPQRTRR